MVCHKQVFKDTKSYLNAGKNKRYREHIEEKKIKGTTEVGIRFSDIQNDSTNNKEASHMKLKLNCMSNPDFFKSRVFNKKELCFLCDAYNCQYNLSMKKDEIADSLCRTILDSSFMVTSIVISGEEAETTRKKPKGSKTTAKSMGKGKGKVRLGNIIVAYVKGNTKHRKNGFNVTVATNGCIEYVLAFKMRLSGNR